MIANTHIKPGWVLGLTLLLSCQLSVHAQSLPNNAYAILYSTDVDYKNIDLSGAGVLSNEVIQELSNTALSKESPPAIAAARGVQIDGFHRDNLGRQYYSFNNDFMLNTGQILKSDIIRCNNVACTGYTWIFNGQVQNFKNINIDAFTFDPDNGDLLFSIEAAATIDGGNYTASDVIRYNGTSYSLFYDGATGSGAIGSDKNIDALSVLAGGTMLISLASDGNHQAGGFSYLNSDILSYDIANSSWSFAYRPITLTTSYGASAINLVSLDVISDDLIFKNGFEATP